MKETSWSQATFNRKSIRSYKEEEPSDEVIEKVVRAGQSAPFASQVYSVLLSRKSKGNSHPFDAPLLFTICIDFHKLELIMEKRDWEPISSDLLCLIFGIEDASLMAENMVIAAEGLGMGSCFLGTIPYRAEKIAKEYDLPKRVFPLVGLTMGYPAEDPPTRPRYPLDFVLFEEEYPDLEGEQLERAMKEMDEGYLDQDYYRKLNAKIPIQKEDREETFTYEDYGWTEHISRKWGQWWESTEELLEEFRKRGFDICDEDSK